NNSVVAVSERRALVCGKVLGQLRLDRNHVRIGFDDHVEVRWRRSRREDWSLRLEAQLRETGCAAEPEVARLQTPRTEDVDSEGARRERGVEFRSPRRHRRQLTATPLPQIGERLP